MSASDGSPGAKALEMPESFSFGLEERAPTVKAIKLELDDASDCVHEWYRRDKAAQTLQHQGTTILECRNCKRTVAVYDWKLQELA